MIRIRTTIGEKRIITLMHNGKWYTLGADVDYPPAMSLLQAGENHLNACLALSKKS
jgi:hypothetical protein